MNADQLSLIKHYLKAGMNLHLRFYTGPMHGTREVTPVKILKLVFENKGYWFKTDGGDFLTYSTPLTSIAIEVAGSYQPLFDTNGNTLIRQSPMDKFTATYYHYIVSQFDLVRPGSMVIIDNINYKALGRVINKGNYGDLMPIFQDIHKKKLKNLSHVDMKDTGITPDDIIFDVVVIKMKLEERLSGMPKVTDITFIVPFNMVSELGFTITELI